MPNTSEITGVAEDADHDSPIVVPMDRDTATNDVWFAHFQRFADQIADLNARVAFLEQE